jgi:RNA polymerase sigma-70 factor (ECF subfamily)
VSREALRVADIVPLAATGHDATTIVEGLRRGSPEAAAALYDRVAGRVNRLVARMLGADPEHDDVVHQVFLNVFSSVGSLREAAALDGWVVGLTVNTVRRELRRRKYRRLLRLDVAATVGSDEASAPGLDPERQMVAHRFYAALERMAVDDRIAFSLRTIEGCALAEVAVACGCSLATAKRRVARAYDTLTQAAERDPVLAAWTRSEQR